MATTAIELPPDLQAALEDFARRSGRTEVEVVREAIEKLLQAQRRPRPRSFGMGDDSELNGVDTEGWLKANWRPE